MTHGIDSLKKELFHTWNNPSHKLLSSNPLSTFITPPLLVCCSMINPSFILLFQYLHSLSMTRGSQMTWWPIEACSATADSCNCPFMKQALCSFPLTFAVRPVYPIYASVHVWQPILYTTPGWSNASILSFTFPVNLPLHVFGTNAVFTSTLRKTRLIAGVMNVDKGLELSKLWLGFFQA